MLILSVLIFYLSLIHIYTKWPAAIGEYFRGGGFSSQFKTKGTMPLTMCRINLVKGIGPVLQIVEGWSVELPEDIHTVLDERTNPTWPTTWFVPRVTGKGFFKDAYSVMARCCLLYTSRCV